jgi:hypothetical protein
MHRIAIWLSENPRWNATSGRVGILLFATFGEFPGIVFGEADPPLAKSEKRAESKAHKRPNLPCTWYFALYRASGSPLIAAHGTRLPRHPKTKEITNSTRNITNKSFAMPADAAAIPPNPKIAATSAMIKNITAHPNIPSPPQRLNRICRLIRAPLHGVEAWPEPNSTSCPSRKHHFVRSSVKRSEEFFDQTVPSTTRTS